MGAVLTQNTAWQNVEKAIACLKQDALLTVAAIASADTAHVASAIRPSGYFNVKARRLQSLCRWLVGQGGIDALAPLDDHELRRRLLSVHGIGPETADDILLYALQRPVFVIDSYTRRIFSRLGRFAGDEPYEHLRQEFQRQLSRRRRSRSESVALFNEYHALIVRHAKVACRKSAPACVSCCLKSQCQAASLLTPNMV